MSLADDLLKQSSAGMNSRLANMETEPHIIIGDDRFISVPDELKRIAVQYDHRVETVTFDCPRYWDGYDMSKMKIYINYTRADGLLGMYLAENVFADEQLPNIMHFDWTLTRNVTGINGPIVFMVCVKRVDRDGNEEVHWNSERNLEMYISEGLEGEEVIQDLYPDIFTQMLQKMDETVDETEAIKNSAINDMNYIRQQAITETTKIKNDALKEVSTAKTDALTEITKATDVSVSAVQSVKNSALIEITKVRDNGVSDITTLKNSTISEVNQIKNQTVDRFNQSLSEASGLVAEAKSLMGDVHDLVDETQSYMDATNELHNETLEWVKEVTEVATPEAMKNYTTEYFENNPTAILDAVDDIYSLALDSDIDAIISGRYKSPPDAFEEEFSLATNPDIDAIIAGDYVETPDDEEEGDKPGNEEDDSLVTDKELDDLIGDLFDEDDGDNTLEGGTGGVTDEDLDNIIGGLF